MSTPSNNKSAKNTKAAPKSAAKGRKVYKKSAEPREKRAPLESLTNDFPVFMIRSKQSLEALDQALSVYGDVGYLRVVYDGEGNETDRSIAVFSFDMFEALCADGYDTYSRTHDMVVSQFALLKNHLPGPGRLNSLFISVPKNEAFTEAFVRSAIVSKLQHLSTWNIIPSNSWKITIPLKSREHGGVRGGCFVSFSAEVSAYAVAMLRLLLTDTYWPEHAEGTDREVFKCFWTRDRKGDGKSETGESEDGEEQKELTPEEKAAKIEREKAERIKKIAGSAETLGSRPSAAKGKGKGKKAPVVPVTEQPSLN